MLLRSVGLIYFLVLIFLYIVIVKYLKLAKKRRDAIGKIGMIGDIFKKMYKLLYDEEMQVAIIPGLKKHLKSNMKGRSIGDFYGVTMNDPIRANGPIGEIIYISRLVNKQGKGFIGHRLGTISGLDVFEAVSTDFQDWKILWFDMYWNIKDITAPAGLELVNSDKPWPDSDSLGLSATNRFCSTFPYGFWGDILSATNERFGCPMVKPLLQSLNIDGQERPPNHAKIIEMVFLAKRAEGIGEDS